MPTHKPGMLSSLAIRDFRFVWVSNLATSFAMQMQMVARGWLIYDMTSSPLALTWVMLSSMVPSVLFSLVGGLLADRMPKKSIMLAAQILNTLATFLLATIIYVGDVTFWHFIYFGVFHGVVVSLSMPARSAVIPEIVKRKFIVNAMALQSSTFNLSRIVGPALAGGLIAIFASGNTTSMIGVGIVFYVIATLDIVAVIGTLLLHYKGDPKRDRATTMLADLGEGFRYMKNERIIFGLMIMGFVPMTFGFTATFLLPAFNSDILNGGPNELGLIMAAMGIGALLGSLTLARLGDIGKKGPVLFATSYFWAISLAGFALSTSLPLAITMGALTGLFGSIMGALNMSIVQLTIRPEIRGRVMAIQMMAHGLTPIGIIPISAAAEFIGIDIALLGSAFLLATSMLLIRNFYPELRSIDKGHGPEDIKAHASRSGEAENREKT